MCAKPQNQQQKAPQKQSKANYKGVNRAWSGVKIVMKPHQKHSSPLKCIKNAARTHQKCTCIAFLMHFLSHLTYKKHTISKVKSWQNWDKIAGVFRQPLSPLFFFFGTMLKTLFLDDNFRRSIFRCVCNFFYCASFTWNYNKFMCVFLHSGTLTCIKKCSILYLFWNIYESNTIA